MTAPTEPLKTTSEEIAAEQERLELWVCLACRQTWLDDTSLIPSGGGYGHSLGHDLCGEVVEVNAARDDAAELRAALDKMSDLVFTMLNAEDELSRAKGPGGSYPEDVAGYHAARRNAWEELCSLAQEHDDPDALRAALAATEGSEP